MLVWSCHAPEPSSPDQNKARIIETLQKETQYFCERKLDKWAEQWSHQNFVSKMYAGQHEFTEFDSWQAIWQNTIEHIQAFPNPIPIPETAQDYRIELFEQTAFVFFAKKGEQGPIRETRFMVKENDQWKIARMQTIY